MTCFGVLGVLVLLLSCLSQKVYTFSFIVGSIIPKSVKCIHSATKTKDVSHSEVHGTEHTCVYMVEKLQYKVA